MNGTGTEIFNFALQLWKFPRSITGNGVRQTLSAIQTHLPDLLINSVPTGTSAFDWKVPKEWNVHKAFIVTPEGKKICDFAINNLHLVGYSIPIQKFVELEELQKHLHSIPEKPDAIPYITSYYKENWGFCITQNERNQLTQGKYQVVIESELNEGVLNYGELVINGMSSKEIFFSTYICHPSMANNELSGPCLATFIAKHILDQKKAPRYTYRFIFIPETIGSIVYLSRNLKHLKENIFAGFNISCVGDERCYSYLPSRIENTYSDKLACHVLKWTDANYKKYTWLDRGSDERQYCAPGIDLPIATIMRSKYGTYPEYHTSLDTLGNVVTAKGFQESFELYFKVIDTIEHNCRPSSKVLCEPQMVKYNLYEQQTLGKRTISTKKLMDFLSYSDGKNSLLDIAEFLNVPVWELYETFRVLKNENLISIIQEN